MKLGCISMILFLVVLILWFPIRDTIKNNFLLKEFSNQLFDQQVSDQTIEINKKSEVGILVANGDHCDFRAKRTFESSLKQEEIKEYYQDLYLSSANKKSKMKVELEILESRLNVISYRITILDGGYPAGFDIRCG